MSIGIDVKEKLSYFFTSITKTEVFFFKYLNNKKKTSRKKF